MKRNYDNDNYEFSEGMAQVKFNGKFGFVNEAYQEVVPPIYTLTSDFYNGVAAVSNSKGKWGYIDKSGKVITPLIYDRALYFNDGMGLLELNDRYGYADVTGKVVIPLGYKHGNFFNNGLACVKGDNFRATYIDKTGKQAFAKSFKDGKTFEEGLAPVCNEQGKWGFIDKTGELVISYKFYNISQGYKNGEARIETAPERILVGTDSYYELTREYIINRNGKIVREYGTSQTSTKKLAQ
ncbi:WG repeat-containing protein [Mucilaginibacter sp. RS28]|uniref:WG repeat-containing protein n=1 Tax=Mucilaginibacter straminoryzae TaxID=2932774 RepID=A0A9X2BC12_9SPHI|nr:WG repeat-containing protein [Mucilaginibacter straminoryzae]MCJ8210407.1 WG repeat-containing protein [Mucilaginibacter straminoryzae]